MLVAAGTWKTVWIVVSAAKVFATNQRRCVKVIVVERLFTIQELRHNVLHQKNQKEEEKEVTVDEVEKEVTVDEEEKEVTVDVEEEEVTVDAEEKEVMVDEAKVMVDKEKEVMVDEEENER